MCVFMRPIVYRAVVLCFFFFKQKTAYEMRISDWSSDVCSSDLAANEQLDYNFTTRDYAFVAVEWNKDLFAAIRERTSETAGYGRHVLIGPTHFQIGRASCRERVCQYV